MEISGRGVFAPNGGSGGSERKLVHWSELCSAEQTRWSDNVEISGCTGYGPGTKERKEEGNKNRKRELKRIGIQNENENKRVLMEERRMFLFGFSRSGFC